MARSGHSNSRQDTARTLPHWLQYQAHRRGKALALRYKYRGIWQEKRWGELAQEVEQVARSIAEEGFLFGEPLVLLTHPRPEALTVSLATQWLGGTVIPLDPAIEDSDLAQLLRQIGPRFLLAEDQQQVDRVLEAGLEEDCLLIYADGRGLSTYRRRELTSYQALRDMGVLLRPIAPLAVPLQPAFRFYQSVPGQGGQVRELSHAALIADGIRIIQTEQLRADDEALAARAFAAAGQVRYLLAPWLIGGFRLNLPESLATRDADRRELGPTLVLGTKETYERLARWVQERLPEPGSLRRKLVDWSLQPELGGAARWLAELLIRRPLRDVIGFTRTRHPLVVGSLPEGDTARLFQALGIHIRNWDDGESWQTQDRAIPDAAPGVLTASGTGSL